jgi:hypothetical protein
MPKLFYYVTASTVKKNHQPCQASLAISGAAHRLIYTDLDSNYQKVTRADIKPFVDTYIIGKPYAAGLIISPDLSKQLNAASFFVAK